jgi:hypothetical protein
LAPGSQLTHNPELARQKASGSTQAPPGTQAPAEHSSGAPSTQRRLPSIQPPAAGIGTGAAVLVIALLWHEGLPAEHKTVLGAAPSLWDGVLCAGEAPGGPKLPAPALPSLTVSGERLSKLQASHGTAHNANPRINPPLLGMSRTIPEIVAVGEPTTPAGTFPVAGWIGI